MDCLLIRLFIGWEMFEKDLKDMQSSLRITLIATVTENCLFSNKPLHGDLFGKNVKFFNFFGKT